MALKDKIEEAFQAVGVDISALRTDKLDSEQMQDLMASTIIPGTNITATYNDTTGELTLASTATGGASTLIEITPVITGTTIGTGVDQVNPINFIKESYGSGDLSMVKIVGEFDNYQDNDPVTIDLSAHLGEIVHFDLNTHGDTFAYSKTFNTIVLDRDNAVTGSSKVSIEIHAKLADPYHPVIVALLAQKFGVVPKHFIDSANTHYLGEVAQGTASKLTTLNYMLPTLDPRDLITDAINPTYTGYNYYQSITDISVDTSGANEPSKAFSTPSVWVDSSGLSFNMQGKVHTGYSYATLFTDVNDLAMSVTYSNNTKPIAGFILGRYTSTTQTIAFARHDGSGNLQCDFPGRTPNRINVTGSPTAYGTFIMNRASSVLAEIWFGNDTVVNTVLGNNTSANVGVFPTVEEMINRAN